MGHSVCNWTFKYGNHCIIPACRPINCSTYSHSLHVEGDMLWCLLSNATDEKLIPRRLSWAWVNETGHERQFNNFWSNTDLAGAQVLKESNPLACAISGITNQTVTIKCNYSNPIGAQKYDLWIKGKKANNRIKHPLGLKNTTYFEIPCNSNLRHKGDGPFGNGTWALKGHYWICGHHAYRKLPNNWSGTCYVGYICPFYFLLPEGNGDSLGVRIYDDLNRHRRSIDTSITGGSDQTWGNDKWTPQRIIRHYGPATWNPSEWISGAREPIYNLNRIIRLQAVLEIITNETAHALDLLADQATQM